MDRKMLLRRPSSNTATAVANGSGSAFTLNPGRNETGQCNSPRVGDRPEIGSSGKCVSDSLR